MTAARVHGLSVFVGGDPDTISIRYGSDGQGEYAVLDLDVLQVHVSQASPEFLMRLSAVFAELAQFRACQSAPPKAVAA